MALAVTQLCKSHKTDKCRGEFPHSELYDTMFAPFQDKHIRLLEIGINKGHSIGVWEDYFPNATLLAVDIKSKCLRHGTGRTKVSLLDQSDECAMIAYASENGMFDIIIDDGSHMTGHQILTFETLWPYVLPGGIYVVEDTLTSYDSRYVDSDPTCVQYFQGLVDQTHTLVAQRADLYRDINTITFKQDMIMVTKI